MDMVLLPRKVGITLIVPETNKDLEKALDVYFQARFQSKDYDTWTPSGVTDPALLTAFAAGFAHGYYAGIGAERLAGKEKS